MSAFKVCHVTAMHPVLILKEALNVLVTLATLEMALIALVCLKKKPFKNDIIWTFLS